MIFSSIVISRWAQLVSFDVKMTINRSRFWRMRRPKLKLHQLWKIALWLSQVFFFFFLTIISSSLFLLKIMWVWTEAYCFSPGNSFWNHVKLLNSPVTQRRFRPKYIEITFKVTKSTFRSLEMYSKRRYKICICSGDSWGFRNYYFYFPENIFWMQFNVFRKWEFFWFLFLSNFESENFRFPFFPSLVSAMWKIQLPKIVGN